MKLQNLQTSEIKEKLTTILQTIVADESVSIEFVVEMKNNFFDWSQNFISENKNVFLPQISVDKTLEKSRAAADMAAGYLLFHNSQIYERKSEASDQKFFDEFEKIRIIAEIKKIYRGAAQNILHKIEDDIFSGSNSFGLTLLKEIFAEEILPKTKESAKDLEDSLNCSTNSFEIKKEIKSLAKRTANQADFAVGVERVFKLLKSDENLDKEVEGDEKSGEKSDEKNNKNQTDLSGFGQENVETFESKDFAPKDLEEEPQEILQEQKIADFKESDLDGEVAVKLDKSNFKESGIEFKNAYKIFTSKFDEVIFPQKLIGKTELELLRDQLDLKMAKLSAISKRMSLKLKRKLLSKQNSFSERDANGGILDRKKFTRLVTDPTIEDVWITHKSHEYQDTCLTILLDNSGSMRGNPIVMSALACEIIAEILEKFSVKTEIIGFTTADWKGGKARKLWESSGKSRNPGRLNELRHVIYKHFNQSLKKARINLGLMLKEGVLKENIDGEALLFARSRLMQQSAKRKILMVISDGTPVDDSTALANDGDILSDHLRQVIHKIEKDKKIEIVGVGIGHATDDFYQNSIAIKSPEELGDVMIEKLAELL